MSLSTSDPQTEFEQLAKQAEKLTSSANVRSVSIARWRDKALKWVNAHAPESGARYELLAIRAARKPQRGSSRYDPGYYANSTDKANISRAFKVLTQAADGVLQLPKTQPARGEATSEWTPPEITDSLVKLRQTFPLGRPLGFIMMSFGKTQAHTSIQRAIQDGCERRDVFAARADEHTFHDDLYWNVLTYLHAADFGVAVFERLQADAFNPNVSFELGYLKALRKPVLLLKDQTLRTLHTDLMGKLYQEFDPQSPGNVIPSIVARWLTANNVGRTFSGADELVEAKYGAGSKWKDVTRHIADAIARGEFEFRVGNDTLGGDPVRGVRKTLRIKWNGPEGINTASFAEGSSFHFLDLSS